MSVEVCIPTLGESLNEGVIVRWMKSEGEEVATDEALLELETDKASLEIPAPAAGILRILKAEGATVEVGEVVARLDEGEGTKKSSPPEATETTPPRAASVSPAEHATAKPANTSHDPAALSPAVRRLITEKSIDPAALTGSGKSGRITKGDVLAHIEAKSPSPEPAAPPPPPPPPATATPPQPTVSGEGVERVPMTRLRKRIAQRLVEAQQNAAILTTFNEVDLGEVMTLRKRHKEAFAERHGVPLGFMSFFAKAVTAQLAIQPICHAQIDGDDIVYFPHVNLGIAVSSDRGLVVPVIPSAETLDFAGIESEISRLAGLARIGKLSIADLSGGTFTISNGGVFGSLLSTPILNPPQTAILGMHTIQKRAVVVDDQIVIRPMMNLALSYDHRLIDGKEAVGFLVGVKKRLEDPSRLLLDL